MIGVDSTHPNPGNPNPENLDPAGLEEGLVKAAGLLRGFYEGLDDRRVSPAAPLSEIVDAFEGTLGEQGVGLDGALEDVQTKLMPHVMAVPHPLYLGLINSSPLAGGIVAESIIGGLNNNAGAWQQGPSMVAAEHEVLRCFKQLLGLHDEAEGIVLPGGSYASLHGLQLARDSRLPEWREKGPRALSGNPRVYVSDSGHFSAARAAQAIGVAPRDVVYVPTVGRGQIDPRALAALLKEDRARGDLPFALVATLGTTGTGAMDSLPELIELCREYDLWLHVDACYGGAGILIDDLAQHFEGIDQADSVAVDPHKWFFVPMVAGLLFTRHPQHELEVFDIPASYIPTGERIDGFRRGLPTSRRCAGFAVWMALRAHGLSQIRAAVQRNIHLARRLELRLEEQGFRVLPDGELSIVCARWEPTGLSQPEIDALQVHLASLVVESGDAWFGTVHVQGQSWLRFALVSTFTGEQHVDFLARRLGEVARG